MEKYGKVNETVVDKSTLSCVELSQRELFRGDLAVVSSLTMSRLLWIGQGKSLGARCSILGSGSPLPNYCSVFCKKIKMIANLYRTLAESRRTEHPSLKIPGLSSYLRKCNNRRHSEPPQPLAPSAYSQRSSRSIHANGLRHTRIPAEEATQRWDAKRANCRLFFPQESNPIQFTMGCVKTIPKRGHPDVYLKLWNLAITRQLLSCWVIISEMLPYLKQSTLAFNFLQASPVTFLLGSWPERWEWQLCDPGSTTAQQHGNRKQPYLCQISNLWGSRIPDFWCIL